MIPTPRSRSLREDWRELRDRLALDRARIREMRMRRADLHLGWLLLDPSYQALVLHRWSRFLFLRGHRWMARILWQVNLMVTGADIGPRTDIGGGLYLPNPVGIALAGRLGTGCTACAQSGCGGIFAEDPRDVGGGPGLPNLGDGVVLECGSLVLGTLVVGDGVVVGPRAMVERDVPAGMQVAAVEPRRFPREAMIPASEPRSPEPAGAAHA